MELFVKSKFSARSRVYSFNFLMLFLTAFSAFGQTTKQKPALETLVTIRFSNERTGSVLNNMSQQAGFSFSYNPAIVDPDKLISGNFQNKPVREVLNTIFSGKLEYRERKSYVIIQKAKELSKPADKIEFYTFSGYTRTDKGSSVPWVSVFDKASLESTVSNDYGFYRIRISEKLLPLTLNFTKQGFTDTTIMLTRETTLYNNIILQPVKLNPPTVNYEILSDSAENTVATFFKQFNDDPNDLNIKDTLTRKYQVSFLPYVGTNLKLSGNVINEYSFNIFGGISMGTSKMELGGFFNIDKSDVRGLQIAGFTNLDGGNFKGLQLAGFINLVRKNVSGVQLAGFANINPGSYNGIQLSGFVNASMDSVSGIQGAGFCNIAGKSMKGTQASGFINIVADTLSGMQIGFINVAKHLNGTQLGFLNLSKSTSGVPIGFLSYVNHGYHKLEISADEVFPLNIAVRTGVNVFHNILTAGMDPASGDSLIWNFGYGLGTSLKLSNKTFLDLDLTSSQIVEGNSFDAINLLNKFYIGIDTKLVKKCSLAFGITMNGQLTKATYTNYPEQFSWYKPNIFYDESWTSDNTRLQMWFGAKAALRFF